MEKEIRWIVKNWDAIPSSFKVDIKNRTHDTVILLLDRQKPSIKRDYSFDEERISVNKDGKIIWGFDSGCSCPSPWHNNAPECYVCTDRWSEFEVELKSFDDGALAVCKERVEEIKNSL